MTQAAIQKAIERADAAVDNVFCADSDSHAVYGVKVAKAAIREAVEMAINEAEEVARDHVCRLSGHELCDCQSDIRGEIRALLPREEGRNG